MLDRVIKDRPVVFSMSWGATEDGRDWAPAAIGAINERLHVAAALGITICVSAGDDGSSDEQDDGRAHCAFPASSPFVLAVGGTQMEHHEGQLIERVWHKKPGRRTPNRKRRSGATGGGVSTKFERPKWQAVRVKSLNKGSIDGRVVPDVTALSGPPWYAMVLNGKWTTGGGTSASAPLWAALLARINALLPKEKRQRFLTPWLYKPSGARRAARQARLSRRHDRPQRLDSASRQGICGRPRLRCGIRVGNADRHVVVACAVSTNCHQRRIELPYSSGRRRNDGQASDAGRGRTADPRNHGKAQPRRQAGQHPDRGGLRQVRRSDPAVGRKGHDAASSSPASIAGTSRRRCRRRPLAELATAGMHCLGVHFRTRCSIKQKSFEERSDPDCIRGDSLDCFASLAMTS